MRKRISQKEVTDFVEAVLFSVAFIAQREAQEEGWDGKITTPVSAPVTLYRLQAMAQAYFLRHAVERGEVSTCVSHWEAIAPREAWQKRVNRAVAKALIDLNVVFEQVAWSPADALKPLAGHTYMRIVRDYAGSNSYVNSQHGFALHMNPRKYAQCVEVRRIRTQENTGSKFSEYSTEAAVKKQLISETRKDLMDVRSALSIP